MKLITKSHKYLLVGFLAISGQAVFAQNQKMGDNLGNHKALQSLNMNGKDVFNINGVVIGAATVDNNAIALQVGPATAGTKAMVVPRVDDLLNAANPSIPNVLAIDGMMVFNNANKLFYVRQNGAWVTFGTMSLANGNIYIGDNTNTAVARILSGDVTIDNTGSSTIATATKGNSKVLTTTAAGVTTWADRSQFASTDLNATQILIGNASNIATASSISGDATLDATARLTIANNAITTAKILDANVTTGKIADLNITTGKVADAAITTPKIADLNITTAKLADNAITTSKITDLNVTGDKIALTNGSVFIGNATGAASMQTIQGDISMNNTGTVVIGAGTRANNMVLTTNIGGTLAWVDRSKFASTDLNATQLLIGNASNIATASSMSGDATLDATAKLTIANNAITTAKILDANVTTAKVADAAITTAKILDANVTPAKIALTDGNVLIGNATGAAAAKALSGDITIANTGISTIATATKGNNKVLTTTAAGVTTWVDKSSISGMMKNIGVLTSNPWSALTTANNAVTVTIPVTGILQDDGVVVNIKASDATTFDYIMILSSRAENGSVVVRLADMRPMPDTGVYVPPAFSTLNFIVTSYHVQ